MMPEGHHARAAVILEILPQPLFLGGTRLTSPDSRRLAVGVQRDHVPAAEVKAVVAPLRGSRAFSPVGKVRAPGRGSIFAIPGRRPGAVLEPSPGRVIAVFELL